MGRGQILSGGTDGLYQIEVDLGADRLSLRTVNLNRRISGLDAQITRAESALNAAIAAEAPYRTALENAINAAIAAPQNPQLADAVVKATAALYDAQAVSAAQRAAVAALKFDRLSAVKELEYVQTIDTAIISQAWCADLTEDATGSVATIEIPGEPVHLLVAPGNPEGSRTSIAPAAADGRLLSRGAMTGPQAYFNAAILPGWQKWMPDYRKGTISNLDLNNDTATVTLDDIPSSAQGLSINQESVLTAVPIKYMECNALAFEDGDQVVVEFEGRDWTRPRVIGFVSNPKPCARLGYTFKGDGPIRDADPDINRESLVWNGQTVQYVIPPDYETVYYGSDYYDRGYAYFSQQLQFWFSSGTLLQDGDVANNLTGLKTFSCRFEINKAINSSSPLEFGLIVTVWGSDPFSGLLWLDIVLRPGSRKSIFAAWTGQPPLSPYVPPYADTSNIKYFTLPTFAEVNNACSVGFKVDFPNDKPRLKINGATIATLTDTFLPAVRSLGRVEFFNINEYLTFPDFFYPPPRIDFWTAF